MRIIVNGEPRELSGPATVAELLGGMAVRPEYVAVEINAQLIPRGEHPCRELVDGDQVEIVTLVGGG